MNLFDQMPDLIGLISGQSVRAAFINYCFNFWLFQILDGAAFRCSNVWMVQLLSIRLFCILNPKKCLGGAEVRRLMIFECLTLAKNTGLFTEESV